MRDVYEVVRTRCDCHPETCCCPPWTIFCNGEVLTKTYDREPIDRLIDMFKDRSKK